MADILPAIFSGHGNPMNALMNNSQHQGLAVPQRTDA
jgi:hypothetical protein